MIKNLTEEQRARFPEFVAKWTAIGLNTDNLDRKAITKALQATYSQVNKHCPHLVLCTSPLAACLTQSVLSVSASVGASVRASVRASVSASVRASFSESVRASVSVSLRASVSASVRVA